MAKRHKEESDEPAEEYQFIPPDFDEETFIHKEMVSFHTTTVLFFAGIVAALASWGAFAAMDGAKTGWLVGMVILAISFAFLRPLFRVLNIDIAHWARREWLGTAFLMFFTWLAFFIMFVNPPVSDFADPVANLYISPGAPIMDEPATFDLFLHDNKGIDGYDSSLVHTGGLAVNTPSLERINAHHYSADVAGLPAGTYLWKVTVHDETGRSSDSEFEFTVGQTKPVVEVDPTDTFPVQVQVPSGMNVWAVYAQVQGGDRVFLEQEEKVGAWVATAAFKGWSVGNNTFDIVIEEKNRFDGNSRVDGGIITSGPYELNVANPGDYTKSIPKKANPTVAPVHSIPGVGPVLLAVGLLGVAAIIRRK